MNKVKSIQDPKENHLAHVEPVDDDGADEECSANPSVSADRRVLVGLFARRRRWRFGTTQQKVS